jgi:hypothetical protein
VKITDTYSFILPVMPRNKQRDFFVLQCKDGGLDVTDWVYMVHYGVNKNIKDFKFFLHYSFYGKVVTIVIFEYKDTIEYGILYEDNVYYQADTIYYSNVFLDTNSILLNYNFNKHYKLKEIKTQDMYVETYEYTEEKLEVDLNKMYYVKTIWNSEEDKKYLRIDEYNIELLKEFWIDSSNFVAINEIKIASDTNIEKYKSNIDKFFAELKKRDKKLNVNVEFDMQYRNFDFTDYIINFEPQISDLQNEPIKELREHFEISKIRIYNNG